LLRFAALMPLGTSTQPDARPTSGPGRITPSSLPLPLSHTCTAPAGSTPNTYCPSTVSPMIVAMGLLCVVQGSVIE